jgi:hypothetical protein
LEWTPGGGEGNFKRVNTEHGDPAMETGMNGAPPIEIRPLTKEEYLATIRGRLTNVTEQADGAADVWAYVYEAGPDVQVSPEVFYNRIVAEVFRTENGRHDQVLIPSIWPKVFVAVIVDRTKRRVHGHYLLDFNVPPRM